MKVLLRQHFLWRLLQAHPPTTIWGLRSPLRDRDVSKGDRDSIHCDRRHSSRVLCKTRPQRYAAGKRQFEKELWEETEEFGEWIAVLDDLEKRLS